MEAEAPTSLFRRDDTFLGVCQALGEDFGFNPVFLRIAFAAPLIFAPLLVIEVYLGLGVVVFLSRMLAPRPKRKAAAEAIQADTAAAVPEAANEGEQLPLPIAA